MRLVASISSGRALIGREPPIGFSRITVDYSDLDAALKDISDADEVHRQGERLQRGVDELAAAVKRLQAPNMKVGGTRSPASSY